MFVVFKETETGMLIGEDYRMTELRLDECSRRYGLLAISILASMVSLTEGRMDESSKTGGD